MRGRSEQNTIRLGLNERPSPLTTASASSARSPALAGTPCALPTPVEGQGETVAFTLTGDGYRTLSEGAGEVLHGVSCR